MAGRRIRTERFALLDDLGFGTLCKLYVESSTSVPDLCQFLFDRTPQGKVGVSLLYKWIDARGYRDAWDHTVRFKERLRQDALNKVELDVPEIDWDLWPQECTSDAHNTARAVKAD